jgi:regulator of sigma E protease
VVTFITSLAAFVVIISVIVFVHEYGHYIVARMCGVHIEVFSIGFGREIFGRTARTGTRWRISWLPLGGYVKMYGEMTLPTSKAASAIPESRQHQAFCHQSVGKRAAILVAGPMANFLLAIFLLTGWFVAMGQPVNLPACIHEVAKGSPAEKVGLLAGDCITMIDQHPIKDFSAMQQWVAERPEQQIALTVARAHKTHLLYVTPEKAEITDSLGGTSQVGRIGISAGETVIEPVSWYRAPAIAAEKTWEITWLSLVTIGQMVVGQHTTDEVGGVLRIAHYSGKSFAAGWPAVLWLVVLLSVNLGVLNLLPIPLLDGGHLAFCALEAVMGKPLSPAIQLWSARVGISLLAGLMVFATLNDLRVMWV